MGVLLPTYKKAIIDDLTTSISTKTAYYYAFASNPIPLTGGTASNNTTDEYSTIFTNDWQMLFGKKLSNTDFIPVIKNIAWTQGQIYDRYDNRDANLDNKNFYVIVPPTSIGGSYEYYMCLNNANGAPSTQIPDVAQSLSFSKTDGYIWRYITSVSEQIYNKFSTTYYSPVYANNILKAGSALYSGLDVVVVANGGSDYRSYTTGAIQSNPTTNLIQIEVSTSSIISNFYTNCGIYIYTTGYNTAQLKTITGYVVNSTGHWVQVDSNLNTNDIIPSITNYNISPRVIFKTDGDVLTEGYTVVDSASGNSISNIIITNPGTNVSRANVSILPSLFGSGANIYAITPPPGGYGSDPVSELNVKGFGVSFNFSNTEGGKIPTGVLYNKIGILKNPYALTETDTGENIIGGLKSNSLYVNATFSQILEATISPSVTYNVGDTVYGNTSGAVGTIAFANQSTIQLTGDKSFSNNEYIYSNTGTSTQITINTLGQIYAKDIEPLYVQNITNVQRSDSQTENYKLIIQL